MKKFSLALAMLLVSSFMISAQNNSSPFKLRYELQTSPLCYEVFTSSDLSLLANDPQKKIYGNGTETSFRIHSEKITDTNKGKSWSSFLGLNIWGKNTSIVNTASKEDITLWGIGFLCGYSMHWNHSWSMDMSVNLGWARYNNDFNVASKDHKYSKNGMQLGMATTLYGSPFKNLKLGIGIKYNQISFYGNKKSVDSIPIQLPKNSNIFSLTPFMALSLII